MRSGRDKAFDYGVDRPVIEARRQPARASARRFALPYRAGFLGVVLALAACSNYQTPQQHEAALRARYTPYLGEPVERFELTRPLAGWEILGPHELVVHTDPRTAYWLSLEPPCPNLAWASSIALSTPTGWITARPDAVTTGEARCRIREIRPLDRQRANAAAKH